MRNKFDLLHLQEIHSCDDLAVHPPDEVVLHQCVVQVFSRGFLQVPLPKLLVDSCLHEVAEETAHCLKIEQQLVGWYNTTTKCSNVCCALCRAAAARVHNMFTESECGFSETETARVATIVYRSD